MAAHTELTRAHDVVRKTVRAQIDRATATTAADLAESQVKCTAAQVWKGQRQAAESAVRELAAELGPPDYMAPDQ